MVVEGRLPRGEAARLCDRVRLLVERGCADLVVCDVSGLAHPDLGTVEALARLLLAARRAGAHVRLRRPCAELRGLLDLVGLWDVLAPCGELPLEPGRETEQREPPRGVEEEGDPADPVS